MTNSDSTRDFKVVANVPGQWYIERVGDYTNPPVALFYDLGLAERFVANSDMLTALQEVLATPGLQSGLQAMCAAAIARATGLDVAEVIKEGVK